MVAHVDEFAHEDMIPPAEIAKLVQTVIELPNNASVSHIPINCRSEPVY